MVRTVALVAAAAAAVIALYVFRDGVPETAGRWIAALLVVAVVAAPAVVLGILAAALASLAGLAERVRSLPPDAGQRAAELRRTAEAIRTVRGVGLLRLPFLLWRLARTAGGARELLGRHAGALPLLSLPFLALSAAAVAATFVLVPAALVLALLLLV